MYLICSKMFCLIVSGLHCSYVILTDNPKSNTDYITCACVSFLHVFILITIILLVLSVPCKARHVEAVMDCFMQTTVVHWHPSDGALMYVVTATTASGHTVTCETNTTQCDFEGLLCGQRYSVSVRAVGQSCSSVVHMTGQLTTGEQRHPSLAELHTYVVSFHSMLCFARAEFDTRRLFTLLSTKVVIFWGGVYL